MAHVKDYKVYLFNLKCEILTLHKYQEIYIKEYIIYDAKYLFLDDDDVLW